MKAEIPTEFYVAFLDQTFDIHWNLHAWLMFGCWFNAGSVRRALDPLFQDQAKAPGPAKGGEQTRPTFYLVGDAHLEPLYGHQSVAVGCGAGAFRQWRVQRFAACLGLAD